MKIKFALLPFECVNQAGELSSLLEKAVESGEMIVVERYSQALMELTDKDYSISLTEDEWSRLLSKVRQLDADFNCGYILNSSQIETMCTCNCELFEAFSSLSAIFERALTSSGAILQLPYEEDNNYV